MKLLEVRPQPVNIVAMDPIFPVQQMPTPLRLLLTVNALLPGPTVTENTTRNRAARAKALGKTVTEVDEEFFRVFRPTTLIGRFASAAEVANLAGYLCGAGASATSGAAMRVDGGVVNQIM